MDMYVHGAGQLAVALFKSGDVEQSRELFLQLRGEALATGDVQLSSAVAEYGRELGVYAAEHVETSVE